MRTAERSVSAGVQQRATGARCGIPGGDRSGDWLPMNLSERFAESLGQPIVVGTRTVVPMYRRSVLPGERVVLRVLGAKEPPPQGVRLKLVGGRLDVRGFGAVADPVLWAHSMPEEVVLTRLLRRRSELRIWNCWRDGAGSLQAWAGDAGIAVERRAGGVHLSCNCAHELTFEDLILRVSTR